MSDVQDFTRWLAQGNDAAVNNAGVALQVSRETNPDELAGDIKLGKAFGVPAGVATANRDTLNSRLQDIQDQTYLSRAPLLTDWMTAHPDNAALAQDDLEHLSGLESFARGFVNFAKKGVAATAQTADYVLMNRFRNRYLDKGKSISDLANEGAYKSIEDGKSYPSVYDYIGATARYLDSKLGESMHVNDKSATVDFAKHLQDWTDYQNNVPAPLAAQNFMNDVRAAKPSTLGETVAATIHAGLKNPIGLILSGLDSMSGSAPGLLAGVVTTAATKNPVLGRAVASLLISGSELTSSAQGVLDEFGIDLKNPADVERMINDPEILAKANERGVIRAGVIAALDSVSMGLAGKVLHNNPMVNALAQGIQESIAGGLGEWAAQKVSGQKTNHIDVVMEAIGGGLSLLPDLGIAGHEFHKQQQDAKLAVAQKEAVDKFLDTAEKSKLKARAPDAFDQILKKATEGTGLQDFFIPAEPIKQFAQADDGRHFGVDLTSPEFESMVALGQDVRVSSATYAANVVGTPLDAKLRDHIRLDPQSMTFAEASDFNAKSEEAMHQAMAEAEASYAQEQAMRSDEAKIYDEMVHQLRAAGRSTEVATAEAMIYPAFYRTMAARMGQDVKALVDQFVPPAVRGELPEGLKVKDVSELDRRIAELRMIKQPKADTRQNLLGFIDKYGGINDPGGELKARDASVIKQGKGKKTLRLRRDTSSEGQGNLLGPGGGMTKHGMENVALAAINAGFMANDPAVLDYQEAVRTGRQTPDLGAALLDAIDRELAGQHDYAGADHADAERQAMLADAEQHLASLGVSLDDPNHVIKAALERDGKRYNQVDPLNDPKAGWRDVVISATLENGETVKVHAGDAVDLTQERIKAAMELLDCVNAP